MKTANQPILLWPDGQIPGALNVQVKAEMIERSNIKGVHDRAWIHISQPSLSAFLANKPNGCGVIIAPGGGYERVVIDKEGVDMVKPLNERGISVFILNYRLPGDGFANQEWVPLQDAQRAIRLLRANAKLWQLKPQCIGVMGFSAGGHVAASLATQFNLASYKPIDVIDEQSARPNFAALLYPVITMNHQYTHMGSREHLLGTNPSAQQIKQSSLENAVTINTPPTFIALANDDHSVPPMNSIKFYEQLHSHHVLAEMHIFERSGHGFGIRKAQGNAKLWPELFLNWFSALDLPKNQ
ncbi:alpha/beta hydrolase [Celerinatantimonas sp. MCCC 1A17872]|uniref:alpha/beta hydrolase n=1 Tax=Celerinatantimonas sp. MCCC 1A17872 TaxID=3177514 RepID=UPI0038C31CB9